MDKNEKQKIDNIICDILINDGPDGHCDGSEVITDFIESILDGTSEEWVKKYFGGGKRSDFYNAT